MSFFAGSDSFSTDSMLHVSLGGSTEGSSSAALCRDGFTAVSEPHDEQPYSESPPIQLAKLFEIIQLIAAADTRKDAVRAFVGELARRFPNANVRCGLGESELKRLYDHRLGWLGHLSRPRELAAMAWKQLDLDHCGVTQDKDGLVICLPKPDSPLRCVVWIQPVNQTTVFAEWLRSIDKTLAAVLWSRPNHMAPKSMRTMTRQTIVIAAFVSCALAILALWPVNYRIACLARVEPLEQRLVAAPFEAVLLSTNVRPGQAVSAGDVLATLDGRPLRLERESIEAEIQKAAKEHDTALATGRVAEAQQAKLRQRQLTRSSDLLADRLERLSVVSPINGIILSGDLNQSVGAPLELGQTLFEICPMQSMAIEIEIPAHEIGYVSVKAATRIRFSAIGGRSMQLTLDDLYPAAEVRNDQNVFIGRIEIDNSDGLLRPGMQGDATTYGPLRPWIWSWIRSKVERVLWWIGY